MVNSFVWTTHELTSPLIVFWIQYTLKNIRGKYTYERKIYPCNRLCRIYRFKFRALFFGQISVISTDQS